MKVKADWSFNSIELDKHFVSETLQNLLGGIVRIEIDVTSNTDDHRQFLSHFGIFGPPHILFFDKRGMHIVGKDVDGYQTLTELESHIRDALNIDASPSSEER